MADPWDIFPDAPGYAPARPQPAADDWDMFPDAPGHAPATPRPATQVEGPPPGMVEIPVADDGLYGGADAQLKPYSALDRLTAVWSRNLRNARYTGTIAGAGANVATGGELYTPGELAIYQSPEATRFTRPSENPVLGVLEPPAALAGQVAGSILTPETFIGPAGLATRLAARAGITGPVARRAAQEAIENAIVNTATDPIVQGMNITAGIQDEYNVPQTLMAGPLGAATGGTIGAARGLNDVRVARNAEAAATAQARAAAAEDIQEAMSQTLLPPPEQMGPRPMTDEEIRLARERMNRGQRGGAGQERTEPPDTLYAPAERAPQTRDDVQAQREAAEAFAVAERQRQRLAGQPETLDTQAAGRPQGVGSNEIYLDQDFPVSILERRFVPDAQGGGVEVARVRRYDPRSGDFDPESVEYEVPVRDLRRRQFTPEPRQATDFVERAQSPRNPEAPRTAQQGIRQEPGQTFRATAPDENVDFPDAGPGRSPLPEQPEGPSPFRTESDAEARFRAEQDRRARGEQTQAERDAEFRAQEEYRQSAASNTARGRNDDGAWMTDDYGFVRSSKEGPIRFADQKQAARWILRQGQKDTDQIFEIANHPSGKGYTVKEYGRARRADARPDPQQTGQPRALPPPPQPRPPDTSTPPPESPPTGPIGGVSPGKARRMANLKREPQSLAGFIRSQGGIKDTNGELRARDIHKNPRLRTIINNSRGLPPDEMLMRAQEAGFLRPESPDQPNRAMPDDLYALIDREARGEKVYRAADMDDAMRLRDENSAIDIEDRNQAAAADIRAAADEIGASINDADIDNIMREYYDGDAVGALDDYLERRAIQFLDDVEGRNADGPRTTPEADRPDAESGGRPPGETGGPRESEIPFDDFAPDRRAIDPEDLTAKEPPIPRARRGTFYSNPFADPGLLYDALIRPVMGWSRRAFNDYADDMREVMGVVNSGRGMKTQLLSTTAMTPILRRITALHNLVFHTTAQRMRTIGRIFKSETAQRVADLFDATGRTGARETYDAAMTRHRNLRLNELQKIMGDLANRPQKYKTDLAQITRMIRSGRFAGDGRNVRIATGISRMLADHLKYLRDAGVDVGEVKNFFPRIIDRNIALANRSEFIKDAARLFQKEFGATREKALESAEDWFNNIMTGFTRSSIEDFMPDVNIPRTRHTKGRVLGPAADEIMEKYLVNDPVQALMQYFNGTIRQAEWSRRMGADLSKWKEYKAQMRAEGVSEDGIQKIGNLAAVAAGMPSFSSVPYPVVQAMSWLKMMANVGALEKATFTSLPEMVIPGLRAGNPGLMAKGIVDTIMQVTPLVKKMKSVADREKFAQEIGLITAVLKDSTIMAARSAQLEPTAQIQNLIQGKFFLTNFLEQYTTATRVAAMGIGRVVLRRYAKDVLEKSKGARSARQRLTEWGVPESDVDGFAKWLMAMDDGMPGAEHLRGDKNFGALYTTALARQVDGSIMRPNAATRPVWANDPIGSLPFQLQAYIFAFHQNFIMPTLKDAARGFARKDYSALDRVRMIAPMSYIAILPALQYALGEVRDDLFGDPEWVAKQEKEDAQKPGYARSDVLRAISRGAGFGKYDSLYNTMTAARFRKSFVESQTGVAGAYWGRVADSYSDLFFNNSPNTVTSEENVMEAMYQAAVEPALNSLISLATPAWARPAGFAALQATGSKPLQKEYFIEPGAEILRDVTGEQSSGDNVAARF